MTDYPSIKPEDVREGDVVRWTNDGRRDQPVTMQGTVWLDENGRRWVGPFTFERRDLVVPDLRLVSRPTPPEPPLRVGDWVMDNGRADGPWQIANEDQLGYAEEAAPDVTRDVTRVEPPVGWPVGVPTEDGGTRWYVRYGTGGDYYEQEPVEPRRMKWPDLIATGGVPAPAVTR